MAELLLPPYILPQSEQCELLDSGTFVFTPQFGAGAGQRQQYSEPILKVAQRYEGLRAGERAMMLALIAAAKGQYNILRVGVGYALRGSFPVTELLTNGMFANGTTSWTSSNAELVLSVNDRVLRGSRSTVVGDQTIRAAVATTAASTQYVARAFMAEGLGPMDYRVRLGTTAGGVELAGDASDVTSPGLRTVVATATGTSTHFNILDGISSRSSGHYQELQYASLIRCARVNGASQTGGVLIIDGLPTSTAGLLYAGDLFEVGGELKMMTAPLSSDSSGNGYLRFAPALMRSPADNDPVIIGRPMGKFLLRSAKWSNRFGVYADLDIELEHIYE